MVDNSMDSLVALIITILYLIFVILVITYFVITKKYSIKYKIKSRNFNIIFALISIINYTLMSLNFIGQKNELVFIISVFIRVFICYFLYKGVLRASQSLADANWLNGSRLLKGRFSWKKIHWKIIWTLTGLFIIWSITIFCIFPTDSTPEYSEQFTSSNTLFTVILIILTVCIIAPIQEELIFRFFLMTLLFHWFKKYKKIQKIIAYLIPSIIWAFLHFGNTTDPIIKIIQVIPLGIALSILAYKKDFEHCVLTHMTFNTISALQLIIFIIFDKL